MKDDVKKLYKEKKIEEGNKLLGYNYFVESDVKHGLENGRKIGFPTLNMEIEEKILPDGVYATISIIDDKKYKSMTNIGTHPSISELEKHIIETHVLDFDEMIYGKVVKVEFYKFLRDQQKFPSLDALKGQLNKDLQTVRNYDFY